VKEQVFVFPGVDEPEAPVRQSLDVAFSHCEFPKVGVWKDDVA
jgi:hypothetical protein